MPSMEHHPEPPVVNNNPTHSTHTHTSATMLVFLPSAAATAPTNRGAPAIAVAAALTFLTAFSNEKAAGALAALGAISAVLGKLSVKRRRDDGWAIPMMTAAAAGSAVVLILSVCLPGANGRRNASCLPASTNSVSPPYLGVTR